MRGRDVEENCWFGDVELEFRHVEPFKPAVTRLKSIEKMLVEEGLARDSSMSENIDQEQEEAEERNVAEWLPPVYPASSKFQGIGRLSYIGD